MALTTKSILTRILLICAGLLCSVSCSPAEQASSTLTFTTGQSATSTAIIMQQTASTIPSTTVTLTSTPLPTSTLTPTTIWVAPYLPDQFLNDLHIPSNLSEVPEQNGSDLQIDIGTDHPISTWVYALVAPFPTVKDGVTLKILQQTWQKGATDGFNGQKLLVDQSTLGILAKLWGEPSSMVQVLPSDQILDQAWKKPISWAVVPFEQLNPRWKVLEIDGVSPIHRSFDAGKYGLSFTITAEAKTPQGEAVLNQFMTGSTQSIYPASNRDAGKLTTVILTGVTALVRATAATMQIKGITYPAVDIRDILRDTDFLHISNEVPFAENCPMPAFQAPQLVFCTRPEYIKLLEYIGANIIDLTGDHFADWGDQAVNFTLDLYKKEGWKIFGGGSNLEEARKALLIEHNGNKLAFIGCNGKDPGYAKASDTRPGAAHCDFPWMYAEISKLQKEGYLVIVTMQHQEIYTYNIPSQLQPDFRGAANAGAVIVSGDQAHQPQAMEFYKDGFIHYGLGNLFFDQVNMGLPMRQAFIDRHVFYNGRYISTELLTIMFTDYAHSRPMTPEERADLLNTIFKASNWQ